MGSYVLFSSTMRRSSAAAWAVSADVAAAFSSCGYRNRRPKTVSVVFRADEPARVESSKV